MGKKNILVIGANGMLGKRIIMEFQKMASKKWSSVNIVHGVDYPDIDITKKDDVEVYFKGKIHYDYVINCSAVTDTVGCEGPLENRSYTVNAIGPGILAKVCVDNCMKLVHISTDYVFSENNSVYEFPVNKYGMHKLLGELNVKNEFKWFVKDYLIIRTSWLYDLETASKSFINKMYESWTKLLSTKETGDVEVKMVDDCFGKPTSCKFLADLIYRAIEEKCYGTIDGQYMGFPISRFEFAQCILKKFSEASDKFKRIKLVPCKSDEFKSVIRHPKYLDAIVRNNILVHGLDVETIPTGIKIEKYLKLVNARLPDMKAELDFEIWKWLLNKMTAEKVVKNNESKPT